MKFLWWPVSPREETIRILVLLNQSWSSVMGNAYSTSVIVDIIIRNLLYKGSLDLFYFEYILVKKYLWPR
jgi:hypothetical protein